MRDSEGRFILSPGPVHVTAAAFAGLPLLHHRTDEFRGVVRETELMLRESLGTGSPIYLLTSSGTGAMEAAVANVAKRGSRVLVVSGGRFGERWVELFHSFGCATEVLRFPNGAATDVRAVMASVERARPELLALTHVESSTGLLFPLEGFLSSLSQRRAERPIIMVDAISSYCVEELELDAWGIDVVVGASQKALLAPPGSSFICMSERARALAEQRREGLYYFDINRYEVGRERGDEPFTPAIQTIQVMHQSLSRFRELGFRSVRERHRKASEAWLAAATHLSLVSYSEAPSSSVQVLVVPGGSGASGIQTQLAAAGFVVAVGQGELREKVIRTGFLGAFGAETLARFVRELGRILAARGFSVDIAAAEESIRSGCDPSGLLA